MPTCPAPFAVFRKRRIDSSAGSPNDAAEEWRHFRASPRGKDVLGESAASCYTMLTRPARFTVFRKRRIGSPAGSLNELTKNCIGTARPPTARGDRGAR